MAAGKKAVNASKSLNLFLGENVKAPFAYIKTLTIDEISNLMKSCGIGCYNNKAFTFYQKLQQFWKIVDQDKILLKHSFLFLHLFSNLK